MNERSLSHSYMQNQPKSFWIEDPFDIKDDFKGMSNKNHKRQLADYAQELISMYGKYSYDYCDITLSSLPEDDINELVRLYIEATGRELTECVNGNDFSIENAYTCALLAMLKDDCEETRDKFADVTRKNIITFYSKSLQDYLNHACTLYLVRLHNEQEFNFDQDMDGSVVWGKF